jgi:hypothetical protein
LVHANASLNGYQGNANFFGTLSKYKTYKWVPIKGADQPDELTSKAITTAIDSELAKKGLTRTDADAADLYVGYQTAIGTEKEFTSYKTGWASGPGWGAVGTDTAEWPTERLTRQHRRSM